MQLLALVLMGDFNLSDVFWKCNTLERKQPRRFLECGSELLDTAGEQVNYERHRLDLLFVSRDVLVGDVVIEGILDPVIMK